jgi:ABC-type antimicrobial peptide transport system permease subunit
MKRLFNDPRYFNIFSAFVAFSFWGAWAYFVNQTETGSEGIISGLTQGGLSFIITFFMATLVTFLYQKVNYLSLFIAPFLTVVITGILLASVHTLVSTPNIFYTIAPTLIVSFFFCFFIAYKLKE